MSEPNDAQLRALIRLVPPARALKADLEKALHLQIEGLGEQSLRSLAGLRASLSHVCDDPFVATLEPVLPDDAGDRQKLATAALVAGQLLAFLEGQVGLPVGTEGKMSFQTAPNINITGPIEGLGGNAMRRVMKIIRRATGEGGKGPKAAAIAIELERLFEGGDDECCECCE